MNYCNSIDNEALSVVQFDKFDNKFANRLITSEGRKPRRRDPCLIEMDLISEVSQIHFQIYELQSG